MTTSIPIPARMPGCPATADLDAHSAGDLPDLAEHIASCAGCGTYVAALRGQMADFRRRRPPERFMAQLARRADAPAPSRSWRWVAPVMAAAAVALVLLLRPGTHHVVGGGEERDGVTLKGERLRAFVKRGSGEPQPLTPDATVRPGDALRFAYDAPEDGYLAILDLDGTEAVTVFYPFRGTSAVRVARAQGLLPGTVILDDKPGPEWIVAISSPEPFDAERVGAQLRGQATRDRLSLQCDPCAISTLRLIKGR